jgi:hypothetical protein
VTALPETYLALQRSAVSFAMNRDPARQLYGEVGRPPSALTMWVGRLGNSAASYGLVVLAGIVGIIPRAPHLGIPMLAVVLWLVSYPIGLAMRGVGLLLGDARLTGPLSPFLVCPVSVAFILLFVAIPSIRVDKEHALAPVRRAVHASLAAAPATHPGGPACCRECGAALDVAPGALGVPCVYCGSDNLVALPDSWVREVRAKDHEHFTGIDAGLTAWRKAAGQAHEEYWRLFVIGLLAMIIVWPLAWLLDAARIAF